MVSEPKTIAVAPGREIDRLLDEAARTPLQLVRDGVRFRLDREDEDIWAGYDPVLAQESTLAFSGVWKEIDAEAFKA